MINALDFLSRGFFVSVAMELTLSEPTRLTARVARARSATNSVTKYKLGRGGNDPGAPKPGSFDEDTGVYECDCSGYVAWVLGLNRKPKKSRPWWIETTAMVADIKGKVKSAYSIFKRIPGPVPGCVVVYGDKGGGQGHTGIVTRVDGNRFYGIDCSSGQSKRTGKAITERDLTFFLKSGAVFALLREDLA